MINHTFVLLTGNERRVEADGGLYLHYGVLEKKDHIRTAYGQNYKRLIEIKKRYDPMNLFQVNQNIQPD